MAGSVVTRDQSTDGERTSSGGANRSEIEESRSVWVGPNFVYLSVPYVYVRGHTSVRGTSAEWLMTSLPWEWEPCAEDYECSVSSGTRDQRRLPAASIVTAAVESVQLELSPRGVSRNEARKKAWHGFYPFCWRSVTFGGLPEGRGGSFWLLVLSFMAGDNRYISVFNLSHFGMGALGDDRWILVQIVFIWEIQLFVETVHILKWATIILRPSFRLLFRKYAYFSRVLTVTA